MDLQSSTRVFYGTLYFCRWRLRPISPLYKCSAQFATCIIFTKVKWFSSRECTAVALDSRTLDVRNILLKFGIADRVTRSRAKFINDIRKLAYKLPTSPTSGVLSTFTVALFRVIREYVRFWTEFFVGIPFFFNSFV